MKSFKVLWAQFEEHLQLFVCSIFSIIACCFLCCLFFCGTAEIIVSGCYNKTFVVFSGVVLFFSFGSLLVLWCAIFSSQDFNNIFYTED